MRVPTGFYIDTGVKELIDTKISYWGISDAAGAADGTTVVCADLANEPSFLGHLIKILDGGSFGQTRRITSDTIAGTIVVDDPFTDSAGAVVQIVASTRFVVISDFENDVLYYGTTTAAGAIDGSTLIDTGLATPFTVDDESIGHTVRILTSTTAELVDQEREIYDYDFGATLLYFATLFTAQVPINTTYAVLRNRPSAGPGGPQPEPEVEEKNWIPSWFDNFDVADATADTEKWSSEYISAGAADGSADINTTTANHLYVDILAAAVLAAAEYGTRALYPNVGNKYIGKVDASVTVANPDANDVWAALSVSRGIAWDANNYIRIFKYQDSVPNEGIAVEYNLAGAGAVLTNIINTIQDNIAFKIERTENVWRCYYSLSLAPHHHWILGLEIEDPANSMTDMTSFYLSVYNPEDAVGQQISCDFDGWVFYYTLGNLGDILNLLNMQGGALAYMGYCPPGMAASNNTVVCWNLVGFPDDTFNSGYQMIVLRNANALLAVPEMEMRDITDYVGATGTFTTQNFSANVEENDTVLIIHNSVAKNISVIGVADAGSGVGLIRDAVRIEANDWFNGQQVIMLSGLARGQIRPIYDFLAATDDILVSPDFDAAVAAGDVYAVLTQYFPIVPRAADATTNELTSQVVGSKADTAVYAKDAVSSIIRYLKGQTDAMITASGTADAGSGVGLIRDAARTEVNDWWNGQTILMLTGAAAFQKRPIVDFLAATDDIVVAPNFDAAPGAGDVYVILAHYNQIVPRAADDTQNSLTSHVVGRKDDTVDWTYNATTSSIVRFLKGILGSQVIAEGTLTTDSATIPADNARGEGNDFFNGCYLMTVAGAVAFQPRLIVDFTITTGVFTLDPEHPFTAVPGLVAYIVLVAQESLVPAADGTNNYTSAHVIGQKADTIPAMNQAPDNDDSIVRVLKAIMERVGATPADPDDSLHTILGQRDNAADTGPTTGAETLVGLIRQLVEALYRLTETACADITDPVDMTIEVADNTILANVLTVEGDTSDYDRRTDSLEAISDAVSEGFADQLILQTAFGSGNLTNTGTATIMALDALGATMKDINVVVAISGATAGAGITPTWYVSDNADTSTLDQVDPDARAQHALAGARTENFEWGDLGEGCQLELRIASAADDSALTYSVTITYLQ